MEAVGHEWYSHRTRSGLQVWTDFTCKICGLMSYETLGVNGTYPTYYINKLKVNLMPCKDINLYKLLL